MEGRLPTCDHYAASNGSMRSCMTLFLIPDIIGFRLEFTRFEQIICSNCKHNYFYTILFLGIPHFVENKFYRYLLLISIMFYTIPFSDTYNYQYLRLLNFKLFSFLINCNNAIKSEYSYFFYIFYFLGY